MRFAVVTLGSAGDLHPFLAVARALAERGHEVHLLTQSPYEATVQAEGVRFEAIASARDHERTLEHPLLWDPLQGFGVLWRHLAVPAIGPAIEVLETLSHAGGDPSPLVVLASPLAVGARLARERWPKRIRLLTGYTAPMGLRSLEDPLFLGGWQVPRWVPRIARSALWAGLDRWKLEPMARPALDRWCRELRLPPFRGSTFGEVLHSPDAGLALYPQWFADLPASGSARKVHQVGFPVFEPRRPPSPSPDLQAFLADPAPYVVAYPGSADKRAQAFADRVVAAGRSMGQRTLLLSRHAGETPGNSSQQLRVDEASLAIVLPRASVFIHHGGIGSVAQGLAAGVPQFILASAYDQFENGARLRRLGLADWRPERQAHAAMLQRELSWLLTRWPAAKLPHLERCYPHAPSPPVAAAARLLERFCECSVLPDILPTE